MLIPSSALMYNHRPEKLRVDVVDLDPYGTAAPFIDPAVQCINDGGLTYSTVSRRNVINIVYKHRATMHHLHRFGSVGDHELSRKVVRYMLNIAQVFD